MNKHLEALQAALEQQRKYEAENWPFVDEKNKPTGTGESITYHLASLYCWEPEYVLSLEPQARLERLKEIWRSFSIAGDIIKRYEDATVALLAGDTETEQAELERLRAIERRVEPPTTKQWKRYRGTLLQCLEKAASIYAYTTQEDQGGHDWRVLVPRLEIGAFNRDLYTPQELLDAVKARPDQRERRAVLEHDTGWFGETVTVKWSDPEADPDIWVHAKIYLDGASEPVALIYRIDFEDEPESEE